MEDDGPRLRDLPDDLTHHVQLREGQVDHILAVKPALLR